MALQRARRPAPLAMGMSRRDFLAAGGASAWLSKAVIVVGLAWSAFSSAEALPARGERFLRRDLDGTPYRLFVPTGYRGRESFPLVLFLHGGAGRGTDNERHLRDGNGMLVEMFVGAEKQYPAFVLAPQTSSKHHVESTLAILEDVRARYRVDAKRIYVVGQSLGGYGLLDLVAARPRLFAAAVVIAADGDPGRAQSLATVPAWFFHGEKDEVVPVEGVRRLVAAVKSAGGTVRFTEYAGEGHGLAWLVVKERELVPWLFARRRAPD
jgi:predicted peptidase